MEEEWRPFAACRTSPIDFFTDDPHEALEAQLLCTTCPVDLDCLDYAIETRSDSGIWAGTNHHERRKIRRNISQKESYWDAIGRAVNKRHARTLRLIDLLATPKTRRAAQAELASFAQTLHTESFTGPERLDPEPLDHAVAVL